MPKSFDNQIVAAETSLSIEKFLLAQTQDAWGTSIGKINFASIPVVFADLGAVVEDTPSLKVTREKYQLRLGIPKALQYQVIIGISAEVTFKLYGKTNALVRDALGIATVITLTSATGTRIPLGGLALKTYSLLGVADFLDGTQVCHYFPQCSVKEEYTEEVRPNEANTIMLGFDAISYLSTIHNNERVVGERVYFV